MSTIASREVFNKLVEQHASLQHFMEVSVFKDYSGGLIYVMWFQNRENPNRIERKSVSPYRMFYENLKQLYKDNMDAPELPQVPKKKAPKNDMLKKNMEALKKK